MDHILILEANREYATELSDALQAHRPCEVAVAATVREACLLLAQQPRQLAFIPFKNFQSVGDALRKLQPDLPLVVLSKSGQTLPDGGEEVVQGVLVKAQIDEALPDLLDNLLEPASEATVQIASNGTESNGIERYQGGVDQEFVPYLKDLTDNGEIMAGLLTHYDAILAYYGFLADEQMRTIAARVRDTWQTSNSAMIQFIRLRTRTSDLMLYTRLVRGNYLLTLVALPNLAIPTLRNEATSLIDQVSALIEGEEIDELQPTVVTSTRTVKSVHTDQVSYALVWQPRKPLPGMLQIALRRALERIAEANNCKLKYLLVDAELIHIVVKCPAGSSSAWAAHLFKHDSKEEIQQQFGVVAQLWDRGYYAAESDIPLSEAELTVFLGSHTPG